MVTRVIVMHISAAYHGNTRQLVPANLFPLMIWKYFKTMDLKVLLVLHTDRSELKGILQQNMIL